VGYIEERNAGDAIAALKQQLAPQCHVCRNGTWQNMPARDLVPGACAHQAGHRVCSSRVPQTVGGHVPWLCRRRLCAFVALLVPSVPTPSLHPLFHRHLHQAT
jgi:hypothetical protein